MGQQEIVEQLEGIRRHVKRICSEYGLYGNVFYYRPVHFENSDRNRIYMVAGTDAALSHDSLPSNFEPDVVAHRVGESQLLFYPNSWALDLSDKENEIKSVEELVHYCRNAEFLTSIYGEYDLPVPPKIRFSEINTLREYHNALLNEAMPLEAKAKLRKELQWFFNREKRSGFRKQWLDYYRSDRFPDDAGPVKRILGFLTRHKSVIPLNRLMEVNGDIQKLEMQEFEYKLFMKYLEECFPNVSVAVGKKVIVNNGLDKPGKPPTTPLGRRITSEEYACIRKDRFATEGWACLADVKVSYWEYRDVYYKEVDEPYIATAFQAITLPYAKDDDLTTLRERGSIELLSIGLRDFMNFVSLSKANGVRFYIDKHGFFSKPSLETVHVVYNSSQKEMVEAICDRIINDKVSFSHLFGNTAPLALDDKIQAAELLPHNTVSQHIQDRYEISK